MRKLPIPLLVSLLILVGLYARLDLAALGRTFSQAHGGWLAASFGLEAFAIALTAWRLRLLMPAERHMGLQEAGRLTLLGGALNLVLPFKAGDLAKAYYIQAPPHVTMPGALAIVVFEKGCGLVALLTWCGLGLAVMVGPFGPAAGIVVVIGLILGLIALGSADTARALFTGAARMMPAWGAKFSQFASAWEDRQNDLWGNRPKLAGLIATSLALWLMHLTQIWLFILAVGAWVPPGTHLALSAIALLAGMVPFVFAGIGARDAALFTLYAGYMDGPTIAAVGLLCTLRYLVQGLCGLPVLWSIRRPAASWAGQLIEMPVVRQEERLVTRVFAEADERERRVE